MMAASTDQWRAEIGSFNCHCLCFSKCKWDSNHMFLKIIFIYFLALCKVLKTKFCLSKLTTRLMFHWKAIFICLCCIFVPYCFFMEISNRILGQEIAKIVYSHFVTLTLIAYQHITLQRWYIYNAIYKYDFKICLLETYLDSSMLSDNVSLDLGGYKLVHADQPNNVKRGGVCIYYKESLPVRVINLPHLQEALFLELNDQNKKIITSSLYRFPSQNSEEFKSFLTNFEHLLSDINARKPSIFVILGDFNARLKRWWSNDIDSLGVTKLFSLSTSNGFQKIISEPIHIQRNNYSCIDLIFSDQPSLVTNNGDHASLCWSCHHQIIHCTFNLNISYQFLYQRLSSNYKKVDVSNIQKALQIVKWERLLNNKKCWFSSSYLKWHYIKCF